MIAFNNKISELLKKNPEVLYGVTDIRFSSFYSRYKSALAFAIPHSKMLTLETYDEQLFEDLIMEARDKGISIQIEIGKILYDDGFKYEIPSPTQNSEDSLIAPFSFKYAAVNAGLGWIGKNDVLVTEKYGPRVMLFAILIDCDLPVTIPIPESKCPMECVMCVEACPHQVLKNKQWDIHTKRSETIDYQLCNQKRRRYLETHGRKHSCGFCMVSCPCGV
ncbi:MAG: epoxyqueuosine reductase [Oscillospiraceae bacterium]|nr:epoxyqueuosine reductase [Oscillospiraceae bacterium]